MKNSIKGTLKSSYMDFEKSRYTMFALLNILLAVVSLVMTVVNVRTKEYELMLVTALFTVVSIVNYLILVFKKIDKSVVITVFTIETMTLLTYFVLSGNPEGFSVLWTLLVPSVSLYVLGQKIGIRFSVLTFFMVVFFFWIPFGRSLLYYEYSTTFMLRFPFVYICIFLASLYIDKIRLGVYNRLKETEETARYLYRHDALTGIYSRHAFYEELDKLFADEAVNKTAVALFDIDGFKSVNDIFGHDAGDVVLKKVSKLILDNTCEHCVSCRWGGEEFLVWMQCEHNPLEVVENVRRLIENTEIDFDGQTIKVTVSIGVAEAETLSRRELGDFIRYADRAMYASKAEGKNKVTSVVYVNKK